MRVRIIKSPYSLGLDLPVEVDADYTYDNTFHIKAKDLFSVGARNCSNDDFIYVFNDCEIEPVEPVQPCDITNKCCNQFGERDEIQAIIDKLSADVAQRDERIAELESQRASLIAQVAVMR